MQDRDPRATLGLSLDATRGEAQRAFRRLAKQTHPDTGGDAAAFCAVAGAWADLVTVLPADRTTLSPRRVPVRSPHERAYRAATSRVVWAEPRPSVPPVGTRPDFAAVLKTEVARLAS
jgi:hypothetical protein